MRRLMLRLRNVLRYGRAEHDLAREMEAHLRILEDEYRGRGMSARDARLAARKAMGGVDLAKEQHRDARSFRWLDELRQDIRYAFRSFARTPGFTATAIVTLALGIGANTAMYSAIDAVYLRPLPFPEPERLVRVPLVSVEVQGSGSVRVEDSSRPLEITDLYELRNVFSHTAAHATGGVNVGSGEEPRRVNGTFVTTEFFETMGRQPALGRAFTREETSQGGPNVVVLSHGFWLSQFGGNPSIVGQPIVVNGLTHEVVGVMPDDFRFPAQASLWLPMAVPAPASVMSSFRNFFPVLVIARLAPHVSMPVATERLQVVRDRHEGPVPDWWRLQGALLPFHQALVEDRTAVFVALAVAAGFVLLIACANLANLFLSRAVVRRRELALRSVLGATRIRLIRQLLLECVILALVGTAVGVIVVSLSLSALTPLVPFQLQGLAPLQVDWRVLGVSVAVAMLAAVAFGLWPALGASRAQPGDAIRAEGGGVGRSHGRAIGALVMAEAALACMLVLAAGLMLDSLRRLLNRDLGMQVETVMSARLNFPETVYKDAGTRASFVQAVLSRLADAPGVEQVAAINTLPFAGEEAVGFLVSSEGATRPGSERLMPLYLVVSPGYFQTMGIPLLSGRDLSWTDNSSAPVAVVNRRLARALWPDQDPLGQRLTFDGPDLRTVVGVVDDARTWLEGELQPQLFLPIQEQPQSYMSIVVRGVTGANASALAGHIQTAVRAMDPALPVYAAQPMESVVSESVAPRRTTTRLIGLFGAIAVGLAAVGVYGVLAYSVARRTREIGVRMALGATSGHVISAVMRRGLVLVALGIAIGMAGGLGLRRFMVSILEGVNSNEPAVFLTAPLILLAVALIAVWIPARRASRVDPLIALKAE